MVGEQTDRGTLGYLPQALAATGVMMGVPIGLIVLLVSTGAISSVPLLMAIAVGASLVISRVGAAVWKRRPGGGELLFGELMLWGWLRRLWSERRLAEAVGTIESANGGGKLDPARRAERLRELSAALEASDPYTHGHSRRVARHSATIAKSLRLSPGQVAKVRTAAALHDVGKINTPPAVLRKGGRLTDEEFALVKRHAADGAEMVVTLDDPELTGWVLHHHERLDGAGYPAGLSGEQIPIGARIIAVADTFDAITSTRPYRRARTHREGLAVLAGDSGSRLDPTAVRAFLGHYSDSRPLAMWTALISGPERLVTALGGGVNAASTAVAGVAVAALAALGPAIASPGDAVDNGLAAGSAEPAAVAPVLPPGRQRADSGGTDKRGKKSDRSRPRGSKSPPSAAAAGAVDATAPLAGPPFTPPDPVPASSPVGEAEGSRPANGSPQGGSDPAPAEPAPKQPANGGAGGDEPDDDPHLLPHLPIGPHLPHLPGFAD